MGGRYIGRFAPSPTGALHAGSLVAALASWLDARAHGGQWLVRIEDVDTTRCLPGMDQIILHQLAQCGLHSDANPIYQTERIAAYQRALHSLVVRDLAYPCACSRKDIEQAWHAQGQSKPRHGELIYPGTCRAGLQGRSARAWRLRTEFFMPESHLTQVEPQPENSSSAAAPTAATTPCIRWTDRRLGAQQQDVAHEVGDFILQRADGCFAYQLAVVVDDAWQGVTDVVRGLDLTDNTARQILLQRALDVPTPRYLHTALVLGDNGEKLSKQNGAAAIDTSTPASARLALGQAAQVLGLSDTTGDAASARYAWTLQWRHSVERMTREKH